LNSSTDQKRQLIELDHSELSISRQCDLLNLSKGALYYSPIGTSPMNLALMDLIDRQYIETPFYGSRKMTQHLIREGHCVNRKRIRRLMRLMGIEAVYPGLNLSKRRHNHAKYPYLLRDVIVDRPDFVWSTDITYIRIGNGFMYLTAIIDWYSRYVLNWELSNSLEADFCVSLLQDTLQSTQPEIFNTDQGSQFTCNEFLNVLRNADVKISMDGKGRALDNVFIERLWRSVKYEEVYIKDYENVRQARKSLRNYFLFYNQKRPHQSLNYQTPKEVYTPNQ